MILSAFKKKSLARVTRTGGIATQQAEPEAGGRLPTTYSPYTLEI